MTSPIDLLGRALVPIAVFAAFALFRKYVPAKLPETPNEPSSKDLDTRFEHTKWTFGIGMVLIGILFAWATHAVLVWTNGYLSHSDGPANFLFLPQTAIWWFFPGFGALCLSWEIALQIWSLFGSRAEATQYSDWTSSRHGMDSRKVLRWLFVIVALPIGVLTVLDLNSHDIVGPTEIRSCGYAFATCKNYPFSEARRLTTIDGFRTRDGKVTPRTGIVVDFSDGRRWSSADLSNFEKSVDPAFAGFLMQKTGLPMNFAETEADIPPLSATP